MEVFLLKIILLLIELFFLISNNLLLKQRVKLNKRTTTINAKYGKLLNNLSGSTQRYSYPVNSLAFSPNGEYLASGSDDKTINI